MIGGAGQRGCMKTLKFIECWDKLCTVSTLIFTKTINNNSFINVNFDETELLNVNLYKYQILYPFIAG